MQEQPQLTQTGRGNEANPGSQWDWLFSGSLGKRAKGIDLHFR